MPDGYELFDAEVPEEKQDDVPETKKSNIIITVLSVLVTLLSVCVVLLMIDRLADNNYKVIVVDTNADKYNQVQIVENEEELSELLSVSAETTEIKAENTTASFYSENTTSAAVTTSVQLSKININTASAAQLTQLKGIGEKKAQAIIEYRNENGAFTDIEEITKVSGIGDKIFEGIKDYITVG